MIIKKNGKCKITIHKSATNQYKDKKIANNII